MTAGVFGKISKALRRFDDHFVPTAPSHQAQPPVFALSISKRIFAKGMRANNVELGHSQTEALAKSVMTV